MKLVRVNIFIHSILAQIGVNKCVNFETPFTVLVYLICLFEIRHAIILNKKNENFVISLFLAKKMR